jgi:hypothetical protein
MILLNSSPVGMRVAGTARAFPCAGWQTYAIDTAHASAPASAGQRKRPAETAASVDRSTFN